MLNEERKIRIKLATEIIQTVHSDMCNDIEVSSDICEELCDILILLIFYREKFD